MEQFSSQPTKRCDAVFKKLTHSLCNLLSEANHNFTTSNGIRILLNAYRTHKELINGEICELFNWLYLIASHISSNQIERHVRLYSDFSHINLAISLYDKLQLALRISHCKQSRPRSGSS